jgi:ribosomal peptide maturation radical SAM protein 1
MKVILVTMPFSFVNRPALGISLLRGALQSRGIACDIRYLQLPFAARIGPTLYFRLAQFAPRTLIGEWLFAQHIFGDQLPDPQKYVEEILSPFRNDLGEELLAQLFRLRSETGPYLETCLESIPWEQYDVVGFTSTFAQNLPSLALARRIKDLWPGKILVLGGANCEGEMGVELHRQFAFLDYVCSGEADWLFPELVQRLATRINVEDLPGLIYRRDGETIANGTQAPPIFELDALPFPDYDDYLIQLEQSGLDLKPPDIRLMVETSRGCWWGANSQCIFCGLNSDTLVYRSKSGSRVLEEFTYLAQRYPDIKNVDVTDKILDMHYFKDVIPGLIERNLGLNIFYFSKANLNKKQVQMLKQAGIWRIQPGIESLDSQVLQLMGKGCNSIQNIQLLKWASEQKLDVIWNFITGFPGEVPQAYQRMADMLQSLIHLQPPTGLADQVRLDRFSPMFSEPGAYGITNIRPAAAYRYVYPFPPTSLSRLAYYFDFDYADGQQPESYTGLLNQAVEQWRDQPNPGSLLSLSSDGRLTLYDTRPTARQKEIVLQGIAKAIYTYCDEGQTLAAIIRHFQSHPEYDLIEVNPTAVQSLLDSLVEARVMLYTDDRYLSLAISIDEPARDFIDSFISKFERQR